MAVDAGLFGAAGSAKGRGAVVGGDDDAVGEEGLGDGEGHEALQDLVGRDLHFGQGAVAEGAGVGEGDELASSSECRLKYRGSSSKSRLGHWLA